MRIKFFFLILLILGVGSSDISAQDDTGGAPANQTPKTISGGVLNGKATNLVKPPYPSAAQAVRAEGAVNVQVTIDESGNVISATAVSGHPLLRAGAVQAARQSKFSPTMLSGQPVKVTGIIVYNFVLPKLAETRESEKLIPMGLAMFLTAMKDIPGDEESAQILRDLGDELPAAMKTEKSQFDKLARAKSASEKGRIIDEIIASMRKDLTGTDAWMIDLGKQWGGAIGEAFKITDSEYSRERQKFIKSLQGMNWLLESPPKDISENTIDKIRAIASYNDETDAISPEFISDFFKASFDFIQYMIDDGKLKS
ncbi:MAG TPA: energy transducer TonB [Pyrinomonadaceae bacterium]|nr:energy transducer TonB [Pyrinomonadaceae bacterium]